MKSCPPTKREREREREREKEDNKKERKSELEKFMNMHTVTEQLTGNV